MSAYLSCSFLQGGIVLWPDNHLTPCCLGIYDNLQTSVLRMQSNPGSFDTQAWQRLRDTAHAELAKGVIPPECRPCPQLQVLPKVDPGAPFFTLVNIINSRRCNISCNFCYLRNGFREVNQAFNPHIEMFHDMVFKGLVASGTTVYWGGGEPALHPNLRELYSLFSSAGCRQHFDTNATIYMDFLENDLGSGSTTLSCSLMTPHAATYQRVMGRDFCAQAWKNAARYAATGGDVRAKFVMLPENVGQEESFVEQCKRLGISILNLDREIYGVRTKEEEATLISRAADFVYAAACHGVDLQNGVSLAYAGQEFLQKIHIRGLEIEKERQNESNMKERHVTLTQKGKSKDALAGQIFLLGVHSDVEPVVDMQRLAITEQTTWTTDRYRYFTEQFYYFTDSPESSLSFTTHYIDKLVLRFVSHSWSGLVSICINRKKEFIVDLYSSRMQHLEVDLLTGNIFRYYRVF